jgi:hypothetical protein
MSHTSVEATWAPVVVRAMPAVPLARGAGPAAAGHSEAGQPSATELGTLKILSVDAQRSRKRFEDMPIPPLHHRPGDSAVQVTPNGTLT